MKTSFANKGFLTEVFSDGALDNVIRPNSERLRAADGRYHLDDLSYVMLKHTLHPSRRRYVAIDLYIASQKDEDSGINAKAKLDSVFLPSWLVYLSLYAY